MNPQPKPEPHATVKARRRRTHAEQRRLCRIAVWERDKGRCVVCGKGLTLAEAHVHEVVYRSRGGSDVEPVNCVTLCQADHAGVHAGVVRLPENGPERPFTGAGGANVKPGVV